MNCYELAERIEKLQIVLMSFVDSDQIVDDGEKK